VTSRATNRPPADLVDTLANQARDLGFDLFGIAPAVTPKGFHRLVPWIEAGYAAEMAYFQDRLAAYADPGQVLAEARSLIVLTYPYANRPRTPAADSDNSGGGTTPDAPAVTGKIARYAWGTADYHDLIHPKLKRLRETMRQACPDANARGVVDSAPLMEREFAQLAGLGWAGKNSLLLNRQRGSYFFLACLLTTLDLPPSEPQSTDHCGTCTRCLDACPTDAFAAAGVVDSRRCISYLTIENRGPIPRELRAGIGDWLFGCDVCQEVCPWNEHAAKRFGASAGNAADSPAGLPTTDPDLLPRPERDPIDLIELLSLDEAGFRDRFRDSALWRPRRRGILRNAAICAGNARNPAAAPVLVRLLDDAEPLIRGAVAWALGELGGHREVLASRLLVETDPQVRHEIETTLGHGAESAT